MSTNYEAPVEVRTLEKMLNDFSYSNGYDVGPVFNDTLRYIIHGFSPGAKPFDNWQYKKEENVFFFEFIKEWVKVMERQTIKRGWFDPFGELYMSCVASKSKQSNRGQFFTPESVCDLMTEINMSINIPKEANRCCSDPTCGSGRTLLSWHVRNPGYYLCAEDIDQTCCLMTVCNFLIHGCVGEVIWHDSLNPDTYYYGWRVNENLNNPSHKYFGIPNVRSIEKEESHVWSNWQSEKEENEKKSISTKINSTTTTNNEARPQIHVPIQLTLF